MVLDRRSLSYAALGLGPSWMLLDGLFAEVALFDRTQPEGLALATYLTAVSAVANTIVVPGHAVVQRRGVGRAKARIDRDPSARRPEVFVFRSGEPCADARRKRREDAGGGDAAAVARRAR